MKMKMTVRHPGLSLPDEFEALGLSVAEAAERLGVSRGNLHRLIAGDIGISAEMALKLEKHIGGTAETWVALQGAFDVQEARRRAVA